jgi:hypothetical protein
VWGIGCIAMEMYLGILKKKIEKKKSSRPYAILN